LDLEQAGVAERHDLVVVALDNERRYVDLLQVLGLVRLGEHRDTEVYGVPMVCSPRSLLSLVWTVVSKNLQQLCRGCVKTSDLAAEVNTEFSALDVLRATVRSYLLSWGFSPQESSPTGPARLSWQAVLKGKGSDKTRR
jgi:hypothetical protein